MSQQSLFGNVVVKQPKKENKKLLSKMNAPKKVRQKRMTLSLEDVYANIKGLENKISLSRPDVTFELIKTQERLSQYIDAIRKNGIVACDTETSGLDEYVDQVCGICLYTKGENPVYIPTNHDDYEFNLTVTDLLDVLESDDIKVIFGNAKFDIRAIYNTFKRIKFIKAYWDVILAGKTLNENEKSHSVKFLFEKYVLGRKDEEIEPDSFKKLFGNWKFNNLNPERVVIYPALDGLMTYEIYEFQAPYLTEDNPMCIEQNLTDTAWMFKHVEMQCVAEVVKKENRGVCIDGPYSEQLLKTYNNKMIDAEINFDMYVDVLKDEIDILKQTNPVAHSKISPKINPYSPSQLAILFYDVLKLQNKEGTRGTGEDVLKFLEKQYPQFDTLFKNILTCRKYKKLTGTYVKAIPEQVTEKTNRLHAHFKQYGTVTGRFSSADPNLQNIPGDASIRGMFVASEGHYLIGSDYSQQEPRILAHVANDENMKQAYINGLDLYAEVASRVFKLPYDQCIEAFGKEGKKRRKIMKDIILSIMYGKGVNNVARGLKISKNEAQQIFDKFYNDFPNVKKYMENTLANAKRTGFVKTVYGRKRRLVDLWLPPYTFKNTKLVDGKIVVVGFDVPKNVQNYCISQLSQHWGHKKTARRIELEQQYSIKIIDNGAFIADAERQTVNSIIQGTAADMTKRALILIGNDPVMKQLGFHTLMAVHDEIIGEAPKENAKAALKRLEELMVQAGAERISVPMKCDGEIMVRWAGENIKEKI